MLDTFVQLAPGEGVFRRQMAQFFEATTDAIIFLDRDYRLTFLNRRAKELLSPRGDVLGTNLFETFPDAVYEGSPFVETYRRSMDLGLPGEFEAFYPEPLNLWLRVQSYPADEGIIIFFRDFTVERLAEEALRRKSEEAERQRAEIETVYRTAPIGLALFDTTDYRYLRLNERQAAFFGLKPEQIIGQTVTEMAPIEGLTELFDQVRGGQPVINQPLKGTLVTDPGNLRHWLVSYFPVLAPDGSVQAITAASLEVTQQKKAEEALIQSEKLAAVGRLASSIAHEINNPLESVTNLIYLAEHSGTLADAREYLQTAGRELRRVAAITNQTLRFHKQATSPQEITAEQLFESVLSIFHGRTLNSRVTTRERTRARVPVRCFEGEIRQVISNLVSNALDAMSTDAMSTDAMSTDAMSTDAMNPGGGILFLRSREGTHWATGAKGVILSIADSGSGMTAETQRGLFNAFLPPRASPAPAWVCGSARRSSRGTKARCTTAAAGRRHTTARCSPCFCRSRPPRADRGGGHRSAGSCWFARRGIIIRRTCRAVWWCRPRGRWRACRPRCGCRRCGLRRTAGRR